MRIIQLSKTFDGPEHVVRNLQFAPDGRAFAGLVGHAGAVATVRWYDVARDRHSHEILVSSVHPETGFFHDPELDTTVLPFPDPVVSPNLELAAFANLHEDFLGLAVADFATGRAVSSMLCDDQYPLPDRRGEFAPIEHTALAFGPDGTALFAAIRLGTDDIPVARGWDLDADFDAPDAMLEPLARHGDVEPVALACSPDGRFVAVGTATGNVLLYDVVDHPKPRTLRHPSGGTNGRPVAAVGFSTKGTRVFALVGGVFAVWEVKSGKELADIRGDAPLTAVAYAPDARTFAIASLDGTVSLRDAKTFAERKRYSWPVGGLHGVAFAPDGLTCAAGGQNGRVVLWDLDG